jgi:hypothetical protein
MEANAYKMKLEEARVYMHGWDSWEIYGIVKLDLP